MTKYFELNNSEDLGDTAEVCILQRNKSKNKNASTQNTNARAANPKT